MDLEIKDKKHYYIFNGIQPEIRDPEIERYKYIDVSLKKFFNALKTRHFDVSDIDVYFFVDDLNEEPLKKYCQANTIKSKIKDFYFFLGTYTTSVHIGRYRTQYDATHNKLNIVKYTGHNWEEDKKKCWIGVNCTVPRVVYQNHQTEYYTCLIEMAKMIDSITQYIRTFPKKNKPFKFDLPPSQMVCQELGTYIVYLNKDRMFDMLKDKMKVLLRGGYRLLSLSEVIPEGAHDKVQDAFIYIPILKNDEELDENVINSLIHTSFNNKYPMFFRPKKAEGLYVVDSKMDKRQIALHMVPINKYDGKFEEIQIMCHREILMDELEIPITHYKELLEKISASTEHWKYNRDDKEIVNAVVEKYS